MKRPFIRGIKPHVWRDASANTRTPGLLIGGGAIGIAAHVTKAEAYELANWLVDAADSLPDPPEARQMPQPCYASHGLTLEAADGTAEPDLPATPAE